MSQDFAHQQVLKDVDLVLPSASVGLLLAQPGSGKTTLLHLAAGIGHPTSGKVRVFGRPPDHALIRRSIGLVPSHPEFVNDLTGRQNLDLLLRLRGAQESQLRPSALHWLHLESALLDRRVAEYDELGRRRLAIAAAVQHVPRLLLIDDAQLDPETCEAVALGFLAAELTRSGGAVLMTTCDPSARAPVDVRFTLVGGHISVDVSSSATDLSRSVKLVAADAS